MKRITLAGGLDINILNAMKDGFIRMNVMKYYNQFECLFNQDDVNGMVDAATRQKIIDTNTSLLESRLANWEDDYNRHMGNWMLCIPL